MVKPILSLVFSLPFRPFLASAPYPFVTMLPHQEGGLIVILEVKGNVGCGRAPGVTTQVIFCSTTQDAIHLDYSVNGVLGVVQRPSES